MTLAVGFFSLIGGIEVFNVRWWYFAQILGSILVALSLVIIFNTYSKHRLKHIFLIIFMSVFSFLMITNTSAEMDNPILAPDLNVRYAFTGSEFSAAQFFSNNSISQISSDYDYATNPSSSVFINYYKFNIDMIYPMDKNLTTGKFSKDGKIKIIRDQIINNPFRLTSGIYRLNYDPNILLSQEFDKIYDSNSVQAYK